MPPTHKSAPWRDAARILPVLLALALLWAAPAARAATFSVSTVAQLDDAIAHTQNGDTIRIAAGTYNLDKTLVFGNNVTLAGAGASTTVLDGGSKMQILEAQGNETLSGLTLRNGQAVYGGAIGVLSVNSPASVTLTNCILSGNSAVYNPEQVGDGEPGQGGAIFVDTGTATLTNCVLSGNNAYGNSFQDGYGGAIYSQNSDMTLTGCTLSGNGVVGRGGAIYIGGHEATLTNDVVKGNTDSYGSGDEITGYSPTLNASYCDIGGLSNLPNNFFNGGNFNDGGRNFDADPQFVRTPGTNGSGDPGDLHLQPGSPCIFRGTNQTPHYLYTDIQGAVRAITPTVGAYEGYQLLVTNTNQSGSGSLAAAVSSANGKADAVIDFDPSVFGASGQDAPKTISLGGTLTFNNNTLANIIGPAPGVVLDGGNANRIFYITGGASVTLNGLQLQHGNAGSDGFGGGLYCDSNCVAVLTDCVLAANSAASGGAIFNRDTAILTDCVLIGNSATNGGAVYNASNLTNGFGGEATLTECTLTGNSATNGGAVCNGANSDDSLTLTDDILYGDSASNGPEIYTLNTPVDAAYCDIKGGVTAAVSDHGSNFSADPLFVTPYSQVTNTNLHVLPGSPCVGAGTANTPEYLPADFTGAPRANPPTVGAYEGQPISTRTTLASSLNPSVFGQSVTFTASVANTATGAAPTGTVQFTVNGANLGGPVTLGSNGTATASTSSLPTGSDTIQAVYSGSGGFQSGSASLTQTVLVANSTSLASSLNPSPPGQSVTFTATVNTYGGPAPQGSVQFAVDGVNTGAPVPLTGTTASFATSALATGPHTVTAAFTGAGFQSSGASLTQTVLVADTTALASSRNPSPAGQSVTFTALVSTHGGPTPQGTIQFAVDGANAGGPVPLTGSQASFATSALAPGDHTVTAAFTGSGFQSSGDSLTQSVYVSVGGSQEAQVTGVSARWGSQTAALTPGASLLPSGRGTDVPWAGITSFTVTLDIARTLTAADVTVHGVAVADYGPVTVSGSGTGYTITLARPISAADRVTLSLGNANVVAFSGALPVLPGDVSGDGAVNASDMTLVKNAIGGAYQQTDDIDGSGAVDIGDYNAVRQRVGAKLP